MKDNIFITVQVMNPNGTMGHYLGTGVILNGPPLVSDLRSHVQVLNSIDEVKSFVEKAILGPRGA
jgi:hypothetical protein